MKSRLGLAAGISALLALVVIAFLLLTKFTNVDVQVATAGGGR